VAAEPLVLPPDEFALLKQMLKLFGDAPAYGWDIDESWDRFTGLVAEAINALGPVVGADGRVRAHYEVSTDG